MKLRRLLLLGGAFFILLLKFAVDVVAKSVNFDWGSFAVLRELGLAIAFVGLYYVITPAIKGRDENPVRHLGFLLILAAVTLLLGIGARFLGGGGFDSKSLTLIPLDYGTLLLSSVLGLLIGLSALATFAVLARILRSSHKPNIRRNSWIQIGCMAATSASAITLRPLDSSTVTSVLFGMTVVMTVVNSFRLPWIVEMTKREKIFALVYTFFLFILFAALGIMVSQQQVIRHALLFYSVPLHLFIQLTALFGAIYCGMAFVSTLFHLPTAEAFERKQTEVSSLHNLSRLVTQVLDFSTLVDTVTSMTLDVCQAQGCWLELVGGAPEASRPEAGLEHVPVIQAHGGKFWVQTVGRANVPQGEIDELVPLHERSIRDEVLEQRKPVVVDDLRDDRRFARMQKSRTRRGSLVAVPLLSHGQPIGILYATKGAEFGFVRGDVDVISTFADQATIAIENSRLIKKSIERERLLREMLLAQEMQKRLLPQTVPTASTVEIDAVSSPAFEVGGDYYDFVRLDEDRIGIVVGDVSGKGVPAAFYMSEVKGIFLALANMFDSPREFLIRANQVLSASIDKHSFVSLIYAILNVRTGRVVVARAGHCPMLLLAGELTRSIRPDGLGLGLTDGPLFAEVTEEFDVALSPGDVFLLYTDGVTEARAGTDEYGSERLEVTARRVRQLSAPAIKDAILQDIEQFVGDAEAHHDDLTLVVVKWKGDRG